MLEKIKLHLKARQNLVFFVAALILTGTLGFGLGRLSRIESAREPVRITTPGAAAIGAVETVAKLDAKSISGSYIASRNGTKYYRPWCGGVSRIKEENKVYFATKEEAEQAGLTPAANCQ